MCNTKIKFTLLGKPCCKQSVRLGKYGAYQNKTLKSKENIVKQALKKQFNVKAIEDCILLKITCFFAPKYLKQAKNRHLIGKYYDKKPDADNIAKFYCDCLKDIVIADDNIIVDLNIKKYYSEEYKTEIELTTINYK
jgi:Holliday junction resolvase RusA-like endonuclease